MTTHRTTLLGASLLALLCMAAPASAQEWLLDDALAALGRRELDALKDGVADAPVEALEDILDEEASHLEALTEDDLEAFADGALARLKSAREEERLRRAIGEELRRAGVFSRQLLERVLKEERDRLDSMPERAARHMVRRAVKAVVLDRLAAVRDARLDVARVDFGTYVTPPSSTDVRRLDAWLHDRILEGDGTPDGSAAATLGDAGANAAGDIPLPNVTLVNERREFERALVEKVYRSELGELRIDAARVDGLAHARVGKVSFTDSWGRTVEGLGARFTARARVTGLRATVETKELELAKKDLGLRARLESTLIDVGSTVLGSSTTILSERGISSHNEVHTGTGVSASVRVPMVLDLKVVTLRITPYASAHAGLAAEAHATLDVEWTGLVRLDVGASFSTGVGVGGGVIVEVELGRVIREALDRLIERIKPFAKRFADRLLRHGVRGPGLASGKLTLTPADVAAHWAERGATPPALTDPQAIAARFAPILYQRVTTGAHDFIRRVDFDGDWDARNNWENSATGDLRAFVYYDLKETASHRYITYSWFYARRASKAAPLLRNLRRHENDMSGCIVVVRKGAPRGQEVEAVMSTNGKSVHHYAVADEDARWRTREGHWNGQVAFVDELDHPLLDWERTHPLLWVDNKDHDVYGMNGRNETRPFDGREGVVYVPTGQAEAPDGERDPLVGYALLPLSDLLAQAENDDLFTVDRTVQPNGAPRALPRRFRGDEGINDRGIPPWAWRDTAEEETNDEDESRRRREWIEEGDVFADPARAVAVLFRVPGDFSREYTLNPWLGVGADREGAVGALAGH